MNFNSTLFVFGFLPATLILNFLFQKNYRIQFLFVWSLIFYLAGGGRMILILLADVVFNYLLVIRLDPLEGNRRKAAAAFGVLINVLLLGYYKYLPVLLKEPGSAAILAPIGLSYFTFRCISYILDVYYEKEPANRSFTEVGLYICFFPQILMGPITQYSDVTDHIHSYHLEWVSLFDGLKRIVLGLGMKVIVADTLGNFVDGTFLLVAQGKYHKVSAALATAGAIGFVLQEYMDFAGYSHVAIGLSEILGFPVKENFLYPILSKSVSDFWRRWHISLGSWLKTYIYTPCASCLMQTKNPITHKKFGLVTGDFLALFFTWAVCGIWHGAGLKYFLWGMYFFLFLWLEHLYEFRKRKHRKSRTGASNQGRRYTIASMLPNIYTILVVVLGETLFRASSLRVFGNYCLCILGLHGNGWINTYGEYQLGQYARILLIALIFSFPVVPWIERKLSVKWYGRLVELICLSVLLVLDLAFLFTNTYTAYIYYQY